MFFSGFILSCARLTAAFARGAIQRAIHEQQNKTLGLNKRLSVKVVPKALRDARERQCQVHWLEHC